MNVPRALRASLLAAAIAACGVAASAATPSGPIPFDTPQAAADALIAAAGSYDVPKLLAVFGPQGRSLVTSADHVQDKKSALAFASEARAKLTIAIAPEMPNRATLVVGIEAWPLPVPLIERDGKWYFDATAGRVEIALRRIGANELDAIQVCRDYVAAQHAYALQIHDGSGVNQYARKIVSSAGKHDGLYWRNTDGTPGGPLGETVAKALAEGYAVGDHAFHGYYFKTLTAQGPAAPLGSLDFVIQGAMIGGFALVAVPAEPGVTGDMTFMVGSDGIVYQKNLGANSVAIVKGMERYNPDPSWRATGDRWPLKAFE